MSDEFLNHKEKVIKIGEPKKNGWTSPNISGLCSECHSSNSNGKIRNGRFVCVRCDAKIERELNHG